LNSSGEPDNTQLSVSFIACSRLLSSLLYGNSEQGRTTYRFLAAKAINNAFFEKGEEGTDVTASDDFYVSYNSLKTKELFVSVLAHEITHNLVSDSSRNEISEEIADIGSLALIEKLGWDTVSSWRDNNNYAENSKKDTKN
jgi:hypothetical protein